MLVNYVLVIKLISKIQFLDSYFNCDLRNWILTRKLIQFDYTSKNIRKDWKKVELGINV